MIDSNVILKRGKEPITKRTTVALTEDVEKLLDEVVETKEYENYSQAIRRAVRVAFGKGGGPDGEQS